MPTDATMTNKDCRLIQADCLVALRALEGGSIDMVCADPPYGTTACKWDTVIPLEPLWEQLRRVVKPQGAVVLTASQPFTTTLIASNRNDFRYCWVWHKKNPTGFLDAKRRPLRVTEDICVFSSVPPTYNPAMVTRGRVRKKGGWSGEQTPVYGQHKSTPCWNNQYYPTTLLEISNANRTEKVHPTQKPVALMEYLVRTYTNAGETVLDFCMGSGTTGVACLQTGRKFIGVELDPAYFRMAQERLARTTAEPELAFHAAQDAAP